MLSKFVRCCSAFIKKDSAKLEWICSRVLIFPPMSSAALPRLLNEALFVAEDMLTTANRTVYVIDDKNLLT